MEYQYPKNSKTEKIIRVFSTGQSNSIGRSGSLKDTKYIDRRVRVWNNFTSFGGKGNAFVRPILGTPPFDELPHVDSHNFTRRKLIFKVDRIINKLSRGSINGLLKRCMRRLFLMRLIPPKNTRQNFGIWFCDRLATSFNVDVRYVLISRGGMEIACWIPEISSRKKAYPVILEYYSDTGLQPADIMLWHQGENDAVKYSNTSKKVYKERFLKVISQLRADHIIDTGAPVITGGMAMKGAEHIDLALRELAAENRLIYYCDVSGLKTKDGIHFTGLSLIELGEDRYFSQFVNFLNQVPSDEWPQGLKNIETNINMINNALV